MVIRFSVKKAFILVSLFVAGSLFFGQEEYGVDNVRQVLIPKEVFVGDNARIEYSFRAPADFFLLADPSRINGDTLTFDVDNEIFASLSDRCSVTSAVLVRNGLAYNFILDIIPWKPGVIYFEPFDLTQLCNIESSGEAEGQEVQQSFFPINMEPITIASIVDKLGYTNIRSPASPLVLPGTNYVVWMLIILGIIILVVVGIIIVKFQVLSKNFSAICERMGFYKNSYLTKRRLRGLLKKDITDVEFAQSWQKIMKDYLEYRFGYSFVAVTSKKISVTVSRVTGNMLTAGQENAIDYITSLFIRTDYIKFADGSIDSQLLPVEEHEAVFAPKERASIVEISESAISRLEGRNMEKQEEFEDIELREDFDD